MPVALWDVPPCRALAEAVLGGREVIPAVRRLVDHRARSGFTFDETVGDIDLLAGLHPDGRVLDRFHVGLTVHEAYQRAEPTWWEDGLTGLPCSPHLALRLRECHRSAAHLGLRLPEAYGLLCVRLPAASSIAEATVNAVTAADELRRAFPAGETVVVLSARVFAVLAATASLPGELGGLPAGTETWIEHLPDTEAGLDRMIDELELG